MTVEATVPTVIAEAVTEPSKPPFRLIIAGSTSVTSEELVYTALDKMTQRNKPDTVLSGGGQGPGLMGGAWALAQSLHVMWFYPEWSRYGKNFAEPQRNWEMAATAIKGGAQGGLVAFWDGESPNTRHLINAARSLDLKVRIVRTDEEKKR